MEPHETAFPNRAITPNSILVVRNTGRTSTYHNNAAMLYSLDLSPLNPTEQRSYEVISNELVHIYEWQEPVEKIALRCLVHCAIFLRRILPECHCADDVCIMRLKREKKGRYLSIIAPGLHDEVFAVNFVHSAIHASLGQKNHRPEPCTACRDDRGVY